jgi:hypothetical protein
MFYIVFLLVGLFLGWVIRSLHLGRFFAWSLKSSLEFGGSDDELRAYEAALTKSMMGFPRIARRLLWIKNG